MDELIDFKKRFLKNGELVSIYTELQVNRVLSQLYPDYAVLRRYLVDYGFLLRDERGLKYEVNPDVHGIES